jgi:hypothetical protein
VAGRWKLNNETSSNLVPIRRSDNRCRPRQYTRVLLNEMFWVLGTGARWCEMTETQTCHPRFPGGSGEHPGDYTKPGLGLSPLPQAGMENPPLIRFYTSRTLRIRQLNGSNLSPKTSTSPHTAKTIMARSESFSCGFRDPKAREDGYETDSSHLRNSRGSRRHLLWFRYCPAVAKEAGFMNPLLENRCPFVQKCIRNSPANWAPQSRAAEL